MIKVTMEQFLEYVGPRDILLVSQKECTLWKTRAGILVGITARGYANKYTGGRPAPMTFELVSV